ncbi:MAG: hypothetical protein H6668_07175 [Ardenticatenaceae bacterium]|nr:hypothetical protein [Ardenticatenaceae bacterium]
MSQAAETWYDSASLVESGHHPPTPRLLPPPATATSAAVLPTNTPAPNQPAANTPSDVEIQRIPLSLLPRRSQAGRFVSMPFPMKTAMGNTMGTKGSSVG